MRGSLNFAEGEQGLVITPGAFTSNAQSESQAPGKTPISLINGEQLVELLIQYQVGIRQENYTVPSIDSEYWAEVLGITLDETEIEPVNAPNPIEETAQVSFPVSIQGKHHDQVHSAELLDINGKIRLNGVEYDKPTTAAKTIVTDWKQVNGWDFWRYYNLKSEKWEKIGKLK